MKYYSIAIDGPAGAGKGTVAKMVADRLRYKYIDTGAMYRTVALKVLQCGFSTKDRENVINILKDINIDVAFNDGGQVMFLDGVNVNDKIRTPEVSQGASDVGVIPEVRLVLVDLQRQLSKSENIIMEGRDICTYVLPNADIKIFLTASVEERAKRRHKELIEKGNKDITFEQVLQNIKDRDFQDSNRSFAPLVPADDATIIDSTNLSACEVAEIIISKVKKINNFN